MYSLHLVQELIRGSEAMNRMRQEIDQVIKMILGLAYSSSPAGTIQRRLNATFMDVGPNANIVWEIKGNFISGNPEASKVTVECWKKYPHTIGIMVYSLGESSKEIETRFVEEVYRSLPHFLVGMEREFPLLSAKLQIFRSAAQVQF